ncbi:MAG: hypothetical protein AAFY28_02480 [Actinomycetota bacterium]
MPYTLAMFFVWGLAMALIGVGVGWLLRSVGTRARSGAATREAAEAAAADRWRDQEAELHAALRERDRLRLEVAELRGEEVAHADDEPTARHG